MVRYTLAQNPEVILAVRGKDSPVTRQKAMEKLMGLLEEGTLGTELADGFSPSQFIVVTEPDTSPDEGTSEDPITAAVQTLSALASLKLKIQELRAEAIEVRGLVDILLSDQPVTEAQVNQMKEGFKILKSYAQMAVRFREARSEAEQARTILDAALQDHA